MDSHEIKQAVYEQRNNEARSSNHCCCGIAISIIYSECFCSLSYPACKAHVSYYIAICGLSGRTIFFHVISLTARFSETSCFTRSVCFDFL
jgi:hypothetical protein